MDFEVAHIITLASRMAASLALHNICLKHLGRPLNLRRRPSFLAIKEDNQSSTKGFTSCSIQVFFRNKIDQRIRRSPQIERVSIDPNLTIESMYSRASILDAYLRCFIGPIDRWLQSVGEKWRWGDRKRKLLDRGIEMFRHCWDANRHPSLSSHNGRASQTTSGEGYYY